LLGSAPGGLSFQAAHLGDQPLNHRFGASICVHDRDRWLTQVVTCPLRYTKRVHRDRAVWTAGEGKLRRISDAPGPATAPRPSI